MDQQLMTEEAPTQDTEATSLLEYVESTNIAEKLDEEKLKEISQEAKQGFEYDLLTRKKWEDSIAEWTKLALQVREEKVYPWRGAANVKYPLLSTAAMQFNARAYPSLIPASGDIVKCEVIGKDPDGSKLDQGKRVGLFMSYQLLHEMEGWEDDMDKLLMMLPIIGTLFKKTYYDSVLKHNVSELILPKDLVVNYWAKTLENAERISQIIRLNRRQVKERQLSGLYLEDVELGDPEYIAPDDPEVGVQYDNTAPYEIIEQHTYIDLDDDGYGEPYIVVFERRSGKVLRITARFDDKGIHLDDEGALQKIEPIQYYTKFSFIPNPDGGFYDIGFGLLLTPLNESVNTVINQLLDAGTLNTLQGGFLGKGLKLKMGEQQWKPGEWKTLNVIADDIRKQVVPLPTKEPSKVLLELMQLLVSSGKELASVAEIFVGKMPGQNTPATTTMATIEQGMKVFTAVYKRIYRSLKSEYKKLFHLNSVYMDEDKYQNVMDVPVSKDDFNETTYNVCPTADPASPTQTEKLLKAQSLLEILPMVPGMLNPVEVIRRVLEAQEQPSIDKLFAPEVIQSGQYQPPPDPKMMEMKMKGELEQRKAEMDIAQRQQEMALDARDREVQMMQKNQEHAQKMEQTRQSAIIEGQAQLHKQRIFEAQEASKGAVQQQQTNQQMQQKDAMHKQQMAHTEEKNKLAQKQQQQKTSGNGRTTNTPKR